MSDDDLWLHVTLPRIPPDLDATKQNKLSSFRYSIPIEKLVPKGTHVTEALVVYNAIKKLDIDIFNHHLCNNYFYFNAPRD